MNDDLMSLPQARDAAQWWARLHAPDCTAAERAAFEDWLAAAPGNVEAWLQVEQADALAGELAGEDWLAAELARSQAGARQRRRRPWLRGGLAALAATLVLAVGIGYWQRGHVTAAALRYAAAAGERRDLRLPDGTGLSLAPGAEVLARFDDRRRMVEVVRGQVQFVVGHDPRLARGFAGVQGAAARQPDPGDEPLFGHAAAAGRSRPGRTHGQRRVPRRGPAGPGRRAGAGLGAAGHAAGRPGGACRAVSPGTAGPARAVARIGDDGAWTCAGFPLAR